MNMQRFRGLTLVVAVVMVAGCDPSPPGPEGEPPPIDPPAPVTPTPMPEPPPPAPLTLVSCDPAGPTCGDGEVCSVMRKPGNEVLDDVGFFCLPLVEATAPIAVGEACQEHSVTTTTGEYGGSDCASGTACVQASGDESTFCRALCSDELACDTVAGDPEQAICTDLEFEGSAVGIGFGVCLAATDCTPGGPTCGEDRTCLPTLSQGGEVVTTCFDVAEDATREFNGDCTPGEASCADGLYCTPEGRCLDLCSTDPANECDEDYPDCVNMAFANDVAASVPIGLCGPEDWSFFADFGGAYVGNGVRGTFEMPEDVQQQCLAAGLPLFLPAIIDIEMTFFGPLFANADPTHTTLDIDETSSTGFSVPEMEARHNAACDFYGLFGRQDLLSRFFGTWLDPNNPISDWGIDTSNMVVFFKDPSQPTIDFYTEAPLPGDVINATVNYIPPGTPREPAHVSETVVVPLPSAE